MTEFGCPGAKTLAGKKQVWRCSGRHAAFFARVRTVGDIFSIVAARQTIGGNLPIAGHPG